MNSAEKKTILSSFPAEEFIGRSDELGLCLRHAKDLKDAKGMLIMSAPGVGLSELLRQTYDRLFYENGETIPVYFQIKPSDKTLKQSAVRFLQNLLRQVVAFRKGDIAILRSSADICEISEHVNPADAEWIGKLIDSCTKASELNDDDSFVRQAFSSPLRAAASSTNIALLIDDLDKTQHLPGGEKLIEELKEIYGNTETPFIFGGKRRFVFGAFEDGIAKLKRMRLEPLGFAEAGMLAEHLSEKFNVAINEQTRDLIAAQFCGNPFFINALFSGAKARSANLDSYKHIEQIYAEGLFSGKIKAYYDSIFQELIPDPATQKKLIGLLHFSLGAANEKTRVESWQGHLSLCMEDFLHVMGLLNANEIIRKSSNFVEAMRENETLCDYITARFRLEIKGGARSLAFAESLSYFLKRAPKTMAKFYRRESALGLRLSLAVFSAQEIPASLLDYKLFKENYKEESLEKIAATDEKIKLPQIVYTASTASLYPPIGKLTEAERSAIAFGFLTAEYSDENEIVWIAAEIDSKLEAEAELTEFWCDRLEVAALMCNFKRFRIWLIAPEGFSPGAVDVLKERGAIGSSKKQFKLLAKYLDGEDAIDKRSNQNEYEMVLPMGDDTEVIAAYTIEEIARRHAFTPKAINQIKTALVEACINATEHSHSPDQRIYQKFLLEDNKLTITVSNRGLRFKPSKSKEIKSEEGRRGWGIKLIKSLMDDVKFEQVDDGTRIVMTKYLTE